MDNHVKEYFCQASDEAPHGNFHQVIPLHESPQKFKWSDLSKKIPKLCRGWYELSHLSEQDRIEFLRDYWLAKLPYHRDSLTMFNQFFSSLDDIGVYLVQKKYDDPFEAQLVYSIKDGGGFFRGACGASEDDLISLQKQFTNTLFPPDFVAFLHIHNGFSKATDTGIIPTHKIWESYQKFQQVLALEDPLVSAKGQTVDPATLIPFYESFGMPVFQCFWSEWYPEQEMGNVYYSGLTKTLSDVETSNSSTDNLAFYTFLDWLFFYLERID